MVRNISARQWTIERRFGRAARSAVLRSRGQGFSATLRTRRADGTSIAFLISMTRWFLGFLALLGACGGRMVLGADDRVAQGGAKGAVDAADPGTGGTQPGEAATSACGTDAGGTGTSTGASDCPIAGFVHQGGECVWTNPIRSPSFDCSTGWTQTGEAKVDTALGVGAFSDNALSLGGSLSQTVMMPAAADVTPMALTFRARKAREEGDAPTLGVVLNGGFHAIDVVFDTSWVRNTICLGEGDYGGPLSIVFQRFVRYFDSGMAPVEIDDLDIEPAEPGACAAPGEVLDGDFQTPSPHWSSNGVGQVSFTGTSVSLEAGWPCDGPVLTGTVSIPLNNSAPHAALAVTYSTDGLVPDNLLTLELEGFAVGSLPYRATAGTEHVCIPGWARGSSHALGIAIEDPFGGSCAGPAKVTVDNIELVTDPSCTDDEPLDGGFEDVDQASGRAWRYGINGNGSTGGDAVTPLPAPSLVPGEAHGGSASLQIDIEHPCAASGALTVVQVPKASANQGPALSFWYRLPATRSATFTARIGPTVSAQLAASSEWKRGVACINRTLQGLPVEVSFWGDGGGGGCFDTYSPEIVWVDDVEVTTDASCPAN